MLASIGVYITSSLQRYWLAWVGQHVLADLRAALFRHLQVLSLGYHDKHIIGVTISRVISDVSVINQLLSEGLGILIGDTLLLFGIIFVMISMNLELALVTFRCRTANVTRHLYLCKTWRKWHSEKPVPKLQRLWAKWRENLSGMRVIQAFAQEDNSLGSI